MKNLLIIPLSILSMCSCSCTKKSDDPVPAAAVYSYLALGDSYTIGESVDEQDRFPMQIAKKLDVDGKPTAVKIIAKTGWTTNELSAGIDDAAIEGQKFDFVTLLIGVNNEFRNRPVSTYTPEFTALLDRAVAFANGKKERVFVLSIPDYSYTPSGAGAHANISQRIDEYNAAAKAVCEQKGVKFTDITPISRKCVLQPELVAPDGLHPSAAQYTLWVKELYPFVKSALDK